MATPRDQHKYDVAEPTRACDERAMTTLQPLAVSYVRDRYARREIGPDRRRQLDLWLRSFCDNFGNRPLDQLGIRAVERWQESIAHHRPSSRRIALGCVDIFCRWLVREGEIPANPCEHVPPIRVPRTSPRVLTTAQQADLLACLPDNRARAVVALELGMGLRRAEVAGLSVADYDPVAKMLHVAGKRDDERDVPVPSYVERHLTAYLTEVGWLTGPLIRSTTQPWRGLNPNSLGKLMTKWLTEAGVKQRGSRRDLRAHLSTDGRDGDHRRRRGPADRSGVARSRVGRDDPPPLRGPGAERPDPTGYGSTAGRVVESFRP